MKVKDIESLKKRIKKSQPIVQSQAISNTQKFEELHSVFSTFLGFIFEQNLITDQDSTYSAETIRQIVLKYKETLQDLVKDPRFEAYTSEMSMIIKYLKGFQKNHTSTHLFLLSVCLAECLEQEDGCQILLSVFLDYPKLESFLGENQSILASVTRGMIVQMVKLYEIHKHKSLDDSFRVLFFHLCKMANNSNAIFQLMPHAIGEEDYPFAVVVLEKLSGLEKNNLLTIQKLISWSWVSNKAIRLPCIKNLSECLSEKTFSLPELMSDSTIKKIASFLHFNKVGHYLYNDSLLNNQFKYIWDFFDSKVIKSTVVSNFLEIRSQYINLFHNVIKEISKADLESALIIDQIVFLKCAFMSILDLQTRLEPPDLDSSIDDKMLDFLNFIVDQSPAIIEPNFFVPKIDRLLKKITQKNEFFFNKSVLAKIFCFLIHNGYVYISDDKHEFLKEMIKNLTNEKFEFLLSEIIRDAYPNFTEQYKSYVLIFSNEFTNQDDPCQGFIFEELGKMIDTWLRFSEPNQLDYRFLGSAEKLKQQLASKIISKGSDLVELSQNPEKSTELLRMIEFCRDNIITLLEVKPESKALDLQIMEVLNSLLNIGQPETESHS